MEWAWISTAGTIATGLVLFCLLIHFTVREQAERQVHLQHVRQEIERIDKKSRLCASHAGATIGLLRSPPDDPTGRLNAFDIARSFNPDTPPGIVADAMRDAGLWEEAELYLNIYRRIHERR